MKRIKDYFVSRIGFYVLFLIFIGIYYLVFYLYNGLIDAVVYATYVCLFLIFVYFCIDFYIFYKKSQQLDDLLKLKDVYIQDLPQSSSSIELQYQQLITKLDEMHRTLQQVNESQYNESLDYFTLWVHQIKTPISALRLLIQSREASETELQIQILRIEQYVEMALQYIKMSHMSQDLSIHHYRLENIVSEVIKKQAPFFIYKKLKLDLESFSYSVLTDEKWLSFVLEQILSNALKYTKEGSIHIYMKGDTLCIQDSGIGIKEEDLPRVFEKGFTGYNGRMDKKASGLGLYLCKQIVDNLGYSMNIESVVGKGTLVMLDLHVDEYRVE